MVEIYKTLMLKSRSKADDSVYLALKLMVVGDFVLYC